MGGGTSSYRETEDAGTILLWGSNARETHPIFFHHVLKGIRKGAQLFIIDPRRTSSAAWGRWLGLQVGTDIALANAVAREILSQGLENREFIDQATSGFRAFREHVDTYTLEYAEKKCGVPAALIREMALTYATARNAQICWTLGITEHVTGVDNVLALINLGLLTGHVGRYGSGLNPLRGQNNVQGGGDMGALPDRLPGFQHIENDELRSKFESSWNVRIPAQRGWHLTGMFDAMERGELKALYVIGENPAQSEADQHRTIRLLRQLDALVVQDMFLTKTAQLANVVFPAAAGWCETEGTVTSSERRVQRVRRAFPPAGDSRDDIQILCELGRRVGYDMGNPTAEQVWDELRSLSPIHAGMTYARLDATEGLQWPCYDEKHPGEQFLHGRLWARPVIGPRAPFSCVEQIDPVDKLDDDFPIRLTTGRRLDSYNTGIQSSRYASPLRRSETFDVSPEDACAYHLAEGEHVRVVSRRGAIVAPVHVDSGLRPGLAFLTLHFPDQVPTNALTIDTADPKSGTSEFKATAVRIEKLADHQPIGSPT
jgi:formate dehydrogenase major subunit